MRALAPLALVAALSMAADSAHAKWPRPAAGDSASGDPEVVFTFDDGPHEKRTIKILDELSRRNIHAVFFWVGYRVAKNGKYRDARRALVDRAISDGHILANHTINHVHLCRVSDETAAREIDVNSSIYERLTDQPQLLFRAPYGDHCRKLVSMLSERGLDHMHWDLDPREWKHHSSKKTAAYVIRKLKRLKGRAVLLLHDTKPATVRALPKILDWIEKENSKRRKNGRRPIRIVDGSDLMLERLSPGIADWAKDTTKHASSTLVTSIRRLVPGSRLGALTRR